jgi:hypothetical protein
MQGTLRKFVKQALSLVLEELQKVLNAANLKLFVTLLRNKKIAENCSQKLHVLEYHH